jgi:hypothetical protein
MGRGAGSRWAAVQAAGVFARWAAVPVAMPPTADVMARAQFVETTQKTTELYATAHREMLKF